MGTPDDHRVRRGPATDEIPKYRAPQTSGMDLAGAASQFVDDAIALPGKFAEVAAHDPLNPVLMAFGALFVLAPVVALGYLGAGAFLSLFTVESQSGPEAR